MINTLRVWLEVYSSTRCREINGILVVQVGDGDAGMQMIVIEYVQESNGVACVTAFKLC